MAFHWVIVRAGGVMILLLLAGMLFVPWAGAAPIMVAPAAPSPTPASRPSAPAEDYGGVPYDASQDRGCADCGPNGHPESAKARVFRWAHDCEQSSQPTCQTANAALADSVARLYGEYICNGENWADSGFTAPPPDWAASRHNDPALFQSQTCVGGSGAGTTSAGLSSDVGGLAQTLIGSLDFKALLTAVITGLWQLLIGDGLNQVGDNLAGLLIATPNLLATDGGMANVQALVDALRLAALGGCLVAFTVTVVHFLTGSEAAPQAALGRLLAVMFALGFYRTLVGWLLRGANDLARGVLAIGSDVTTGYFTTALKALVPAALPIWYLLSLVGGGLVIAIGVVKILGLAFLLLTYVAGPLLLPLAIHPRTASWVGLWAEHLVKALLWPVLWALEFRVFGAIAGGLSFVDATGQFNLGVGALGALTSLALLVIMAGTPWTFHVRFTVARYSQVVVRQAGRLLDVAALVATGGAAVTARGATALALHERGTARATSAVGSAHDD